MVQIRSINFSLIFLKTVDVVKSHRRCPKLLISVKYMEMLSNVQRIVEHSEKFVQFTEHLKQEKDQRLMKDCRTSKKLLNIANDSC